MLLRWHDKLAATSARQADYHWSVLQAVFTYSV
jgi:hypothetical protein